MDNQDLVSPRPQNATHPTIALFTNSLSFFFIAFMSSGLNVALPSISQEFQADAILLSWIVTSQFLTVVVFSLPAGRIADIIGIKKVYVYGMILFTASSALAAFSNSIVMLILWRALGGIGGAMVFGNSQAMITAIYPPKQRGRALGIVIATLYIGMSIGPFLGGIMTEHFGWRSLFLTNVPAGILVILLTLWKIKGEWSESKGEKFDFMGSIIYGLAMVALMYGFSLLPEILGGFLTLAGIIGILIFIKWESRIISPILNISIFRESKSFLFANIATLINYLATTATVFLMSLYLQYIKGLTPEQAGLILLVQPAVQAVFSPFTGRLSDKIEPRIVASLGMGFTFIALLLFSLLTDSTSMALIAATLVILGLGFALFASPNSNAVMSSVTPKHFAVASAIMGTMRTIGQMLSMGIAMIIISLVMGRVIVTPEYYPAFLTSSKIIFAISCALCFGGIFASIYKDKAKQTTHANSV